MKRGRHQAGALALMVVLVYSLLPASLQAQELLLPEWKPEVAPEDSKSKKVARLGARCSATTRPKIGKPGQWVLAMCLPRR